MSGNKFDFDELKKVTGGFLGSLKEAAETIAEEAAEFKREKVAPTLSEAADALKTGVSETYEKTVRFGKETIVPAVNDVRDALHMKTSETSQKIREKATGLFDLNQDGIVDEMDMVEMLKVIYEQAIQGNELFDSVNMVSMEYLSRFEDPYLAAEKLCAADIAKCTTSGFLSGLGGILSLPLTLPANVSSVFYMQLKMIACLARINGLDPQHPAVRSLVFACLTGADACETLKQIGLYNGMKPEQTLVSTLSTKALEDLDEKSGKALLKKLTDKGWISLGKAIPVFGALISGGFDLKETTAISKRAMRCFFDGNYTMTDL